MKNKVIIFGCGNFGKKAYKKLYKKLDIIGYTDNNRDLWGKKLNGVKIISLEETKTLAKNEKASVLIAVNKYTDILTQLVNAEFENILVWKDGFIYKQEKGLIPVTLYQLEPFYKKSSKKLSILFLQPEACIRTLKIAKALKDKDVDVRLAYTRCPPEQEGYTELFEELYPISNVKDFVDFLNESEFDIIHSSNEPDYLTILAQMSNIPVVHDCHDLSSGYFDLGIESRIVEVLANRKSAGVIYTSEGARRKVIENFGVALENSYVVENYISNELQPKYQLPKLSKQDGKIHVVYEGAIADSPHSFRYYEKIWDKITNQNIQLHFYSQGDLSYCKKLEKMNVNIHYEGNISSKKLASEMSQYDVGICIFNVMEENREHLENATANKIFEYVNAKIPVAVGDVKSMVSFVESNGFGKHLDLDANIKEQLRRISMIDIRPNVLYEKGFTLESKIDGLIHFYKNIIEKCK